ncbi:MAG TPA: hypothetical protein VHV49_00470 [Pseudonocardiaceae bacterium]|jgi:hypothetical protein|nr:hypothetical protein [Pseudonocardiaceae bacterium]
MSRHDRKELEPSALPPNPSVGELVTEIDRARHEAAHTVAALAERLDPRPAVLARSRQLTGVTPAPVSTALTGIGQQARRLPPRIRLGIVIAPLVLMLLWLRRRHR